MNPTPSTLPNASTATALQWLTSWIAILLLLTLLAKSSWGKPIVYYALWLAVAFLALTHATDIASLINPSQGGTTNG